MAVKTGLVGLPNVGPGVLGEGDEVLDVDAVHGEDEGVLVENNGGARSAEVLAGEVATFPDSFSGFAIEGGGAVAAEVDVDAFLIDGRGAGAVAVDVVAERFGFLVFEEEDVVDLLAGLLVEADGVHFFPVLGGIGEPDLIAHDDGRGPGASFDGSFPNHVFLFAPGSGESVGFAIGAGRIDAVSAGSAEPGPFCAGGGHADRDDRQGEAGLAH